MTVKEDCCHPKVEVKFVRMVNFDVEVITIWVKEVCSVCNQQIDQYSMNYWSR